MSYGLAGGVHDFVPPTLRRRHQGERESTMHCDAFSPSPPGPLLSLRARLGMPAAHWGVAPDPHQGLRPWTPLRAIALRTLLL